MKLFLISQDQTNDGGTFISAVVAAPDEETARQMDPLDGEPMNWNLSLSWCDGPQHVTVRYLGEAIDIEQGVVCASYDPGSGY